MRQFLFIEDFCKLVLFAVFLREEHFDIIALVPNEEYSIADLARVVAKLSGLKRVVLDDSKADGQIRKTIGRESLSAWLP